MAFHDIPTADAAYSACFGAISMNDSDGTQADYNRAASIALAFATEFDNLLNANGAAVTNAQRNVFTESIVRGAFQGTNPNNLVAVNASGQGSVDPTQAASWATVAGACVAKYAAGVGNLQ